MFNKVVLEKKKKKKKKKKPLLFKKISLGSARVLMKRVFASIYVRTYYHLLSRDFNYANLTNHRFFQRN